jgi:anaerobic dimethyl sulfoxide reductase subunit B
LSRLAFFFEQDRCVGCHTCQVACKEEHGHGAGPRWRRVVELARGGWTIADGTATPAVEAFYLSISCNHCEAPKCVQACPAGAIAKDPETGVVRVDGDRCLGCAYCAWACPYGAPQLDPTAGRVGKCDLCEERREDGRQPACVAACPVRALHVGEMDELLERPGAASEAVGLPSPSLTRPSFVLRPHRGAR